MSFTLTRTLSFGRRRVPAWRQLLASPDFQLIAAVNAVIFTTNNGGRSVLMPLLAKEHLAMKTSTLGAQLCPHMQNQMQALLPIHVGRASNMCSVSI